MLKFIDYLSWQSGFPVVMAMSAVLALFSRRLQPAPLRWFVGVIAPIVISYCLYWSPVWLKGHSSSEYSSWEGLFVVPWSLAGFVVFVVIMAVDCLIRERRKRR